MIWRDGSQQLPGYPGVTFNHGSLTEGELKLKDLLLRRSIKRMTGITREAHQPFRQRSER